MSLDNKTRPTGEQLRFVSSKTGEHILDTYLEAAERGNRPLYDLMADLFDSTGKFAADNFQFKIDATTRKYQFRVGLFTNSTDGWRDVTNAFLFRQRGTYATGVAYEQLDVVTVSNTTYICTVAHTSSTSSPDATKFSIILDGTALNTATTSATNSATSAASSATSASTAATTATTKASEASTSATNAATSASSASASAATATTKASESAASATSSASSAAASAASQSAAASSQSASAASASAAAASQTAAASSATSAASSATSATSSASSAATSATTATTKASESAASATLANDWATKTSSTVAGGEWSAKYHAQQAASSATSASTSASDASTSATAAASAKTAAEAARDATLAAYDNFDDRYLGVKSADPTVDNDGNALVAGSLYFNSVSGAMKVYTGSAWVAAYVSGTSFLSLSGGTLTGQLYLYGNASNALEAVPKQQLDSGLAGKANSTHTHAISDVTSLQTTLDAKLDITTAASTYQTQAGMSSYLTTATASSTYLTQTNAASTYQTQSGMSSYLTTSSASSTYLPLTGGTLTQVSQAIVTVSASAIDCSTGNYFIKTATGALTWTFTNVPSSKAFTVILELTNGGTGTQSWPASVKWPSGTAPTLVASGVDVLGFITDDGGTTWRGVQLMKDSK